MLERIPEAYSPDAADAADRLRLIKVRSPNGRACRGSAWLVSLFRKFAELEKRGLPTHPAAVA